jgi:hypothetical protein
VPVDYAPLLVALAIAAIIYVLRERHRRRTRISPLCPGFTMDEAWELWLAGADAGPDAEFVPARPDPPPAVREQARRSLLEAEHLLLAADNPLRRLRAEILRSATACLYLREILALGDPERRALLQGYTEGSEVLLRGLAALHTVLWLVLRQYGRLKYDDVAEDDWFHQFMHVAGPYIREKVHLSHQSLVELDGGAARLVEVYDALLADLERHLLQSPRKKRFVRPDLAPAR